MERMAALGFVAMAFLVVAATGRAAKPDAETIARLTGRTPEVKNGVVRVSVPRSDLSVVADGVRLQPFQGSRPGRPSKMQEHRRSSWATSR